jgi:predicted DNA-binding transcriptional regulator AlpA
MHPDDGGIDALIKRSRAFQRMGMSRTTGWRRERDDPTFPKAIRTGPNSWVFRVADVQRWIETRPVRQTTPKEAA